MFIEKRKHGKGTKYYLVHSYREDNEVKKIRRYLGFNLSEKDIQKIRKSAERNIKEQVQEMKTDVFDIKLSKNQIERLNKFNIEIYHLDKKDWEMFTEDFVYNTNAIEGSTVLRDEVHEILHKKKVEDPDEIETKGVAEAIDYIKTTKEDLSLDLIKKLHKLCFKGSKSFAGKFRKVDVVIRDSRGNIVHAGTHAAKLDKELKEFIRWYNENKDKFNPLVLAAIVHNQFENIHPFQDGNGRVGRLLLNFILLRNKYPPINILLKDRMEYYGTLLDYEKNGKLKSTLEFLLKQYNKVTTKLKKNKKK